ncbi:VOC family protein [Antarcticirhabdus aurantiaca]|uniref:VOC family protein n=1 Tax=Antarcticirhabdus aurantiaca TaxID=2606717 RepID=A0ACD4NSI7_9HYPH|nr:VOC family protein [Antarcticirhabdus aurantiaca]WAJ29749.1 VOC family protein [Jeongeuplla avenae]
MTNAHGTPVWYELVAEDADEAERFYGTVLGWRFSRPPGGLERDYRVAEASGTGVAGIMKRPAGMEMPRRWLVYFGVDDVDRTATAAREAGAAIHIPPTDIPGIGRFAFLADPQGQVLYLMRGTSEAPSRAFVGGGEAPQGHAVWNELSTPDPDAALDFYKRVLSIRNEGGMPMGEFGEYRFIHAGPDCIGAVMGEMPNGRPGWLVYFSVDDVDAAKARLESAGGRSLQGPDEVPGGAFIVVAEDDRGARFGLVGRRGSAAG